MEYHVERIGGKDRYETNRKMMNQIPESKYGDRPKIVNGMDFTQALTCAVDTKSFDWEAGEGNHHPVYINPMFLISPNASEQDLKDITKKLQVPKAFWEKKKSYQARIDEYVRMNLFKSGDDRKRLCGILGQHFLGIRHSYKDESNNHFIANAEDVNGILTDTFRNVKNVYYISNA